MTTNDSFKSYLKVFDTSYTSSLELPIILEPGALVQRANVTEDYEGDAGIDLFLYESVFIGLTGGKPVMARTGVRMAIPDGYAGFLLERSSAGPKFHISLSNKMGLIDSSYRDEILMALTLRPGDAPIHIPAGERLTQLVIVPILRPKLVFTDILPGSYRTGGFGSTG